MARSTNRAPVTISGTLSTMSADSWGEESRDRDVPVTLEDTQRIGELARATIWELATVAFDESFRTLGRAADHEAAQLRSIATHAHADADSAVARAELHLRRL